jgi:hypothetical protein
LSPSPNKKISEFEFIVRAIRKLRKLPYKGIHSVYSGFNKAFEDYFNKNPVEVTNRLAQEGKIAIRPVRGGVMLYLPEDSPSSGGSVLAKILGGDKPGPTISEPVTEPLEKTQKEDELIIRGPDEEEES